MKALREFYEAGKPWPVFFLVVGGPILLITGIVLAFNENTDTEPACDVIVIQVEP